MQRGNPWLGTALWIGLLSAACATGATRPDASGVGDAGRDGGAQADAGPPVFDAGRTGDAGRGEDAGSDAGVDAGPPTPVCAGTASGCGARTISTCEAQRGCRLGNTCTGAPLPCSRHTDSFDCNLQLNCMWDSFGGAGCQDDGRGCSSFIGPDACGFVAGCSYTQACTGTATPCEDLSASVCASQDGCRAP